MNGSLKNKLPILALIIAFAVGAALGAGGYALASRLSPGPAPEPVFSVDPKETTAIRIRHPAADGFITICDRERVEYIVGLLNGFKSRSRDEGEKLAGMGSEDYRLEICRADGYDWIAFNTGDEFDFVRIDRPGEIYPDCGYVAYTTEPGYFRELITMPSTDPGELRQPGNPGPTAKPAGE